jgi:ribosomal protein L21E
MRVHVVMDCFKAEHDGVHAIYMDYDSACRELDREDIETDGFYILEQDFVVYKQFKVNDSVIINKHIDEVYSEFIGKTGKVVSENDDNSFTVQIDEVEICTFDHEMDHNKK